MLILTHISIIIKNLSLKRPLNLSFFYKISKKLYLRANKSDKLSFLTKD